MSKRFLYPATGVRKYIIVTIGKKQSTKNKLESDIQTPYNIIKSNHSY